MQIYVARVSVTMVTNGWNISLPWDFIWGRYAMLVIKEATVRMMSVSLNQSDDFHFQPKIMRRFGSQWPRDVFPFVLENPKDGCLWKHIFLIYLVCIVNTGLHHWGPSPIFVVDNHIYQHAQRSGELGWIRRQLHSWRTTSLPFDLFTRFLSGLRLFLPIVIALTLLQTHVRLHLLRGSDLSCVRLQAEGATVGTWNRFTETKVTLNVCTETPPF